MLKFSFSPYFAEDNNVVHAGAGWSHALSSTIPVELEAGMCSQAHSEQLEKPYSFYRHTCMRSTIKSPERGLQHKGWSKKYKTELNKIPF